MADTSEASKGDNSLVDPMHIDLEVMKSEISGLRGAMQEVGAKMDLIINMQLSITTLQERNSHQQAALDRAFSSIKEVRNIADSATSSHATLLSFVRGGAFVGAILFAFAQWYVLQQISRLEDVSKEFTVIDRRILAVEGKLWPSVGPGGR